MTHTADNQQFVEQVRPYLDGVAKSLVDRLYGPEGPPPGTTLTDIENLLLLLQRTLTERFLQLALDRQALAIPNRDDLLVCPACQKSLEPPSQQAPRCVQTTVGTACWNEPEAYCSRCRRAFFPSEQ